MLPDKLQNTGVEPVYLNACDQEQIQFSGAVQPHGFLLALRESDHSVVQVSTNCISFLNQSPEEMIGCKLNFIFDDASLRQIESLFDSSKENPSEPLFCAQITTRSNSQPLRGILYRYPSNDLVILELEPLYPGELEALPQFYEQARISTFKIQKASTLEETLSLATIESQRLTNFDRVMIYQFHSDYHGEVIAEAKKEGIEPYLGLHYPASDIPKQARELYLKKRNRIIPDVNYQPAAIYPLLNPNTHAPLDLSLSTLRSVSDIHLKYLKNMGVRASMSISLISDEKLWGLIAFHHRFPKKLSFEIRSSLEILAQTLVWKIIHFKETVGTRKAARNKFLESRIIRRMSLADSPLHGLLQNPAELLEICQAEGAALRIDGNLKLIGKTPSSGEVEVLMTWVFEQLKNPIFFTDNLPGLYLKAKQYSSKASGIMAIRISDKGNDLVLWFRPEVLQAIHWAGDPKQAVTRTSDGFLNPRTSFEHFKQTVYLKSTPWDPDDQEAAAELRRAILEIIVKNAEAIKRLNRELLQAIQYRDEFLSVASHELKTPLTTLQLQIHLLSKFLQKECPSEILEKARPRVSLIEMQVERLNLLIDSLLDVSESENDKITLRPQEGTNLSQLVNQISTKFEDEFLRVGSTLTKNISPDIIGTFDAIRIEQGLSNLLTNAIKYGNKGPVKITLKRYHSSRVQIIVQDHGIGIPKEKLHLIFNRFTRELDAHKSRGLGLGLWIVKKTVEAQGGTVWAESKVGEGSRFVIELPIERVALKAGSSRRK